MATAMDRIKTAAAANGWTVHEDDTAYMVTEWRRKNSYVRVHHSLTGRVVSATSNNRRILPPNMAAAVIARLEQPAK